MRSLTSARGKGASGVLHGATSSRGITESTRVQSPLNATIVTGVFPGLITLPSTWKDTSKYQSAWHECHLSSVLWDESGTQVSRRYLAGEENLITRNPLYRDHTLTLSCTRSYFNTYISSSCLAPAGWEKMQARKWYRGEVNEEKQLLTVLCPLDLFPGFANGNQRKQRRLPCRWTAVGGAYLTCFSMQLNRRICCLGVAYL